MTADHGGGAFVLVYLFLAFSVGLPLVVAELILGRVSEKSSVSAIQSLSAKAPAWMSPGISTVAYLTLAICFFVLSYYSVISGWVLHFFVESVISLLPQHNLDTQVAFNALLSRGWLQLMLASVHLILTGFVVYRGLFRGVEKFIGFMMPAFVVLLVLLMLSSLNLSTSTDALRFLFYPDFSKVTYSTLGHALGHVLFTLSVGFGTMITYGSYLNDRIDIPTAGARVTILDTLISVCAGLLIFPVLLLAGDVPKGDPTALFRALPMFLSSLTGGSLFSVAFFLSLYLASLGASVGLFETVVANLQRVFHIERSKSVHYAAGISLVIAIFPSLSSTLFKGGLFADTSLLVFLDGLLVHWILPVVCLCVSLFVYWFIAKSDKWRFFEDDREELALRLFRDWHLIIGWFAPLIILIGLCLQIFGLFQ